MKGSITKRQGAKGVAYRVRYDVPQPDGSRAQRSETCRTRKEAEALLARRLHEIQTGGWVEPTQETVGAFMRRWIESRRGIYRDGTVYDYGRQIERAIVPTIGAVRLTALTATAVQGMMDRLLATGLAPSSVRLVHTVLHMGLAQAVRWRLVPRNVAGDASPPKAVPVRRVTWTAEEARRFLEATAGDSYGVLWRLALDSGMRIGELLALRWADVDLERGVVAVRRTVARAAGGGWTVSETTKSSRGRSIALAGSTVAALRRQRTGQLERRLALGPLWRDEGVVFDSGLGGRPGQTTVRDALKRAIAKAEVPDLRLHDLRHTCATLLLAQGVHPKVVQERLGHASIAITLDRYSHVTMDMQGEAADRLERLLGEGS